MEGRVPSELPRKRKPQQGHGSATASQMLIIIQAWNDQTSQIQVKLWRTNKTGDDEQKSQARINPPSKETQKRVLFFSNHLLGVFVTSFENVFNSQWLRTTNPCKTSKWSSIRRASLSIYNFLTNIWQLYWYGSVITDKTLNIPQEVWS